MRCSACGHDNPEERKFCGECGAELELVCRACGASNHPNERYCANCGKPLLREKERRRRALGAVRALRRRLERVCGAIKRINEIADIARQIREFVEGTDALQALPEEPLKRLRDAAEELERIGTRTERLGEACNKAQKALKYAESCLRALPAWVGPGAGVAAVAVVAVVGALLAFGLLGNDEDEEPEYPGTPPSDISTMVIDNFWVDPAGCEVLVGWEVSGDPDGTVELLRDGTPIDSWDVGEGSFTDSLDEEEIFGSVELTYQLRATNSAGEVVHSERQPVETTCSGPIE